VRKQSLAQVAVPDRADRARCEDFAVQIYFESQSAKLTNEARSVLKGAEALATGCKVASVRVIGLADAVGAPDANLALSKQRADVGDRALDKMGFGNVDFDVGAAGDAGRDDQRRRGAAPAPPGRHPVRPGRKAALVALAVRPVSGALGRDGGSTSFIKKGGSERVRLKGFGKEGVRRQQAGFHQPQVGGASPPPQFENVAPESGSRPDETFFAFSAIIFATPFDPSGAAEGTPPVAKR
jgi:hypothetical protein